MSNLEIEIIVFLLCGYLGIKEVLSPNAKFTNFPLMLSGWILGDWITRFL